MSRKRSQKNQLYQELASLSKEGEDRMITTQKMIAPLRELGLNKYESRVYLSLITEGMSTAKNISDITSIPYGKVYEIINALSAKGLTTIMPSKPMKCQAVSPKEALVVMKKATTDKFDTIEKQFVKELEPLFVKGRRFIEPKSTFLVINGRANINKKIEEFLTKAKKQIIILASENGIKRAVIHKRELQEALDKGVKIYAAGPITDDNLEDIQLLDFCEWRNIKDVPSHLISIDSQESLMIEPIPDDDNILYGRDVGIWILSSAFTQLLEKSFMISFKSARKYRIKEMDPAGKTELHGKK